MIYHLDFDIVPTMSYILFFFLLLRFFYITCIVSWHLLGHAITSVTCFDLQFSRSTRPM